MDADGTPTTFLEFSTLVMLYIRSTAAPHQLYTMTMIEQEVLHYPSSPCPAWRYLNRLRKNEFLVRRKTFGTKTFYSINHQRIRSLLWGQEVLRYAYLVFWDACDMLEPEPIEREQVERLLGRYGLRIDRLREKIMLTSPAATEQ